MGAAAGSLPAGGAVEADIDARAGLRALRSSAAAAARPRRESAATRAALRADRGGGFFVPPCARREPPAGSADVAVLVSDLSGLTKTTRKYGVIHTSGVIVRMRQLCLPCFHRLGVVAVSYEGDNVMASFPTVAAAAHAAVEMRHRCAEHDAALRGTGREHHAVRQSGLGIAWGPAALTAGHFGGAAFEDAYELAEEVAEGAQILVARSAHARVEAELAGAALREAPGGGAGGALELSPSGKMLAAVMDAGAAPPADDTRYLHANLVPFAQRNAADDAAAIDADITARFMRRGCCAVMFRIAQGAAEGAVAAALAAVRGHFTADAEGAPRDVILCEDIDVEPQRDLFFFASAAGALRAVLAAAAAADPSTITGWGLHAGDVLLVPGTDVHWGDPVNTASKVGQDLAGVGEIAVTEAVHAAVASDFPRCGFARKVVQKSGVDFVIFSVTTDGARGA